MKNQRTLPCIALTAPALTTLDESLLEPVLPPVSHLNVMAINVSPSGHVAMNQRLYEAVAQKIPSLQMAFFAYKDRTRLLLRPVENGSYKFPKGGRIKDIAFSRSLIEAGISLPARYTVDWNPSVGGWVGILDSQVQSTTQQALSESLRSPQKKGRKNEER